MSDINDILTKSEKDLFTENELKDMDGLSDRQIRQFVRVKRAMKQNRQKRIEQQKHENEFWKEVLERKDEVLKFINEEYNRIHQD